MLMALGQQVTQMEVWESWCVILTVEAMAAREGGILAVEGDFTNIVSTIRSPSVDRSPVGPVVEDTKRLLTHITRDGFTHIRRVANGAAHHLAHYASHIGTTTIWFEEPPDLPILSFS
ncbi:hypothetical protein GBA52_005274 [Prunus armeniaca]|nr:hypothetical protein GBA52_005274 [Prunus armeniaca]